jgi:hypothetical protein
MTVKATVKSGKRQNLITSMTKEQLAEILNGRTIGDEITKDEAIAAKRDGLLVIYGASDDLMEFEGVFRAELGAYNGTVAYVNIEAAIEDDHRCNCEHCDFGYVLNKCAKIRAKWNDDGPYSWTYETSLPHAAFDVLEGDEKYCRGIVIDAKDLPVL